MPKTLPNFGLRIYFAVLAVICIIWSIFLHLNPEKNTLAHYLFNLGYATIYLSAAVFCFISAHKFPTLSKIHTLFNLWGLGSFCFAAALFIWTFYNIALAIEVPYPSLADVFFLIYYPLMIGGHSLYYRYLLGGKFDKQFIIEAIILFIILYAVLFIFLIQPTLDSLESQGAKILNLIYPLADALIITFAISALRGEKKWFHHSLMLLVFSFLLSAVADVVFSYRSAQGTYWNGDMSDLFFMLAGLMLGLGIIESVSAIQQLKHTEEVSLYKI